MRARSLSLVLTFALGLGLLAPAPSQARPLSGIFSRVSTRMRGEPAPAGQPVRAANASADDRIRSFVQANQLPSFVKNGKLHFAVNSRTNLTQGDACYLKQMTPNLVEFFVSPGFHHLYTRVGDKCYSRITGLSESAWYPSSSERISVLVQLSDSEMGRLNTYVKDACRDPRGKLGPFNYNGGRPPQASNCTSWITYAPIGDRGESMARLLGVWESGFPQGFLSSLMRTGNDRVKAVVVHNPARNFDPSYELNLR